MQNVSNRPLIIDDLCYRTKPRDTIRLVQNLYNVGYFDFLFCLFLEDSNSQIPLGSQILPCLS